MHIKLIAEYKSLSEFEASDLDNLCIIIGKNGSGKSQLIEVIEQFTRGDNNAIQIDVDRTKIQVGNLNHPGLNYLDAGMWNSKISEHWNGYNAGRHFANAIKQILGNDSDFSFVNSTSQELKEALRSTTITELRKQLDPKGVFPNPGATPDIRYIDFSADQIFQKKEAFEVAKIVALQSGKDYGELNFQDFMTFPPGEAFFDRPHLFYSSVEQIFYGYAKRRHLNHLHWFGNREHGKTYRCYSDEDFCKIFEPPWQILNRIFQKHNINYSFQDVSPDSFVDNIPIDFRLIKNSTGARIEFVNLSSGEKIIIALIVKLFTSEFYSKKLELPELVVLDEPDAHLHPELSKLLLDVLNETFVKDLGIKVIITTHSPSTVALAPDESIYELKNDPVTTLRRIGKDEALKSLTFGVPTLSVDYKNQRQVFVESPTDVFYFRTLSDILTQKEDFIFKPYFISAGNCDQVIQLVGELRTAGNGKVFGVIDWDNKNTGNYNVFVHGEKARYSLENFLYDPIYLVSLFLEMGAENVAHDLVFPVGYKHYDIGMIETELKLQEISNWVIARIVRKFSSLSTNYDSVRVNFYNNKAYELPEWYVNSNGHALEEKLKAVFPSIQGKFRDEGKLQEALTKIVAKSYPFWPCETALLLKSLTSQLI